MRLRHRLVLPLVVFGLMLNGNSCDPPSKTLVVPAECEDPELVEFRYVGVEATVPEHFQFIDADDCLIHATFVGSVTAPVTETIEYRCVADDEELTPLTDWMVPEFPPLADRYEFCAGTHS